MVFLTLNEKDLWMWGAILREVNCFVLVVQLVSCIRGS